MIAVAGASQRTGRHSGRRSRATTPATQTGNSTGPIITSRVGTSRSRTASALWAARARPMSSWGQPCSGLPDQVGQGEQDGQPGRAQEGSADQHLPRTAQQQPADHRGDQQGDQPLVVGAQADDQAGQPPPAVLLPKHGADDQKQDQRPDHQIGRGRHQHVPEVQREGPVRVAPGRQGLGQPAATDLAGEVGDDHHRQHREDRGREAQRPWFVGQQQGGPGEQRRQQRLVGVAPGRRQHPEVELVAVVPVPLADQGQQHSQADRRRRDRPPRQWSADDHRRRTRGTRPDQVSRWRPPSAAGCRWRWRVLLSVVVGTTVRFGGWPVGGNQGSIRGRWWHRPEVPRACPARRRLAAFSSGRDRTPLSLPRRPGEPSTRTTQNPRGTSGRHH